MPADGQLVQGFVSLCRLGEEAHQVCRCQDAIYTIRAQSGSVQEETYLRLVSLSKSSS